MTAVDHDVVVVGAGPAGLLAAAELARLGVDVAVFEQRPIASPGSRAIGVHPPVLAALEASGATERILAHAARIPRGEARNGDAPDADAVIGRVAFERVGARFPFVAAVPQAVTEAAIAVGGPSPIRGRRVDAVVDRGDHVEVRGDGGAATARIVVVAAGAVGRGLVPWSRPRVRRYADRYVMADIAGPTGEPDDTAVITLHRDGVVESFPLPDGGRRLVAWDGSAGPADATERLRTAVATRTGDEPLADGVAGATSFGIQQVRARRLRAGRVVVIGDAAHEISPIGGQGMNLGLLDAATLAPLVARWLSVGEPLGALARWERRRLASALVAGRISGLNTALGRPRGALSRRALDGTLSVGLRAGLSPFFARAYAMGFDRDAVMH